MVVEGKRRLSIRGFTWGLDFVGFETEHSFFVWRNYGLFRLIMRVLHRILY